MCHQPDTQRRHYAAKQRKTSNMALAALMESELSGRDAAEESAAESDEESAEAHMEARREDASTQTASEKQDPSEHKKSRPFQEPEMPALVQALDEVPMQLTVEKVISLKKYPILKNRNTEVLYNSMKELIAANKRIRMWVRSGRT